MADGTTKPIEQVQTGDKVLSRNAQTGQVEAKTVVQTFVHLATQMLTIHLSDGEAITCTPEHPIYVEKEGFTPAKQLVKGTRIVTRLGIAVSVSQIAWQPEAASGTLVYNIEVEGDHTYFVGTKIGGIWVHNDCTATAVKVIKARMAAGLEPGEVWKVKSKLFEWFWFGVGKAREEFSYHDVVRVGDKIIDTLTHGENAEPVHVDQWMRDFDIKSGDGDGNFQQFWDSPQVAESQRVLRS